ncbi:YeaC family protein [Pseudomonas zhanjiangensis]|uniref:YeaC family protein n=1 Tax=Pseudomonas zhanjiangensis TaxID=3239015 RepID=A0ABV3YRZ8_9PSED
MSSSFLELIENITPQIYQSLKLAVEIGKWPDGRRLTQEQKELSLQALIAWELQNLPEDQRIGYMGAQECGSKSEPVPNLLFKSSDTLH